MLFVVIRINIIIIINMIISTSSKSGTPLTNPRKKRNSPKFSETEHLVQIYTPQVFIDTLPSSTKRLYVWIYIDGIDVTHALL